MEYDVCYDDFDSVDFSEFFEENYLLDWDEDEEV